MCPLMEAYKDIRRYSTITRDWAYNTAWGHYRRIMIEYDGKTYSIRMLNGDVKEIEVIA